MNIFNWAYEKSINGVAGLPTAQELADKHLKGTGILEDQVDSLIFQQEIKCASSGFIFGLGGIITTLITLPANIAVVMYSQVRMIAAIAHMAGHDLDDEKVKTLARACLYGNIVKEIVEEVGIKAGVRFASKLIGKKGTFNTGKGIPLLGGIVGAGLDFATTRAIGKAAKKEFLMEGNFNGK